MNRQDAKNAREKQEKKERKEDKHLDFDGSQLFLFLSFLSWSPWRLGGSFF
jgi:hypothetical protein